jgi:hypothetical protein
MSNDRHHDEQVSAAYRDSARERTPEHLDHQVLRMAKANAERPQYSRWMAWSRPLAWAATVALCLAITLEVTQLRTPDHVALETVPAKVAAPASKPAPELQKDKREQMLDTDMDERLRRTESASDSMADAISDEKKSTARGASKQAVSEAATAGRMRQSADLAEAESVEELSVAPAYAASHALAADMPVGECSVESRLEPESWLECITDLEAAGDAEAAARQRETLIEVFPDFKLP